MQVEDFLSPVSVAVDHQTITAVGKTKIAGQLGRNREDVPDRLFVYRSELIDGGNVPGGNQDDVLGGRRLDIPKGQTMLVPMQDLRRNLTITNATKKTITHVRSLLSRQGTRSGYAGQCLLLLLFLAGCLPACASVSRPKDNDLNGVVKMFHHDLRWQYHKTAAAHVHPEHAQQFQMDIEDAEKDLHITWWEIRSITLPPKSDEATVRVRLKYYWMPSTVVKDETLTQIWKRINEAWFLVSSKGGPFSFSVTDEEEKKPAADQQDPVPPPAPDHAP